MTSLSIITPTLNCAGTIRATLDSVRPLVVQGAQHIVVDSGSTDGTVELCRNTGAKVIQHPRGNMYAAINAGVRSSDGEFLTYINGDDLLYADAVEPMLKTKADGTEVVYGNIDYVDEVGRFLHQWNSPLPSGFSSACAAALTPVHQQGALFTRALYERLNGFSTDYRYSADFDFFLRAFALKARFQKFAGPPVAAFRVHRNQLTQAYGGRIYDEVLESCRRNGIKITPMARLTGLLFNRGRNAGNFVVRVLRYRHIGGQFIVPRTTAVPNDGKDGGSKKNKDILGASCL